MHFVKSTDQQSQCVALVIMSMPDRDVAFPTDSDTITNNAPVGRSAIVDADDHCPGGSGFVFQRCKSGITGRFHEQTRAVDAVLFEITRRVQYCLFRSAPGSGDNSRMENKRCCHVCVFEFCCCQSGSQISPEVTALYRRDLETFR